MEEPLYTLPLPGVQLRSSDYYLIVQITSAESTLILLMIAIMREERHYTELRKEEISRSENILFPSRRTVLQQSFVRLQVVEMCVRNGADITAIQVAQII